MFPLTLSLNNEHFNQQMKYSSVRYTDRQFPLRWSKASNTLSTNGPYLILLFFLFISIDYQSIMVHSIGTLLHAGPSCIIRPQSRLLNGADRFLLVDYTQVKHRGICYSSLLCKQKGGVAIGKCGIGNSCCVFPQTCNSISVRNSTYFTSPDYPSLINVTSYNKNIEPFNTNNDDYNNDHGGDNDHHQSFNHLINDHHHHHHQQSLINNNECSITIHRMPGIYPICQIRLDIIEYEIEGYNHYHHHYNHNHNYQQHQHNHHNQSISQFFDKNGGAGGGCRYKYDNISSSSNVNEMNALDWITVKAINHDNIDIIEPICPSSKVGQFVMINVQKHFGPFYLTVHTGSWSSERGGGGRRRWNILINQIECNRFNQNNENETRILTNMNTIDT